MPNDCNFFILFQVEEDIGHEDVLIDSTCVDNNKYYDRNC